MNAFVRPAKHVFIPIDEIDLSHTIRPYNAAVVSELAQSIRAIGLQTPLTSFAMASTFLSPAGTGSRRCASSAESKRPSGLLTSMMWMRSCGGSARISTAQS